MSGLGMIGLLVRGDRGLFGASWLRLLASTATGLEHERRGRGKKEGRKKDVDTFVVERMTHTYLEYMF